MGAIAIVLAAIEILKPESTGAGPAPTATPTTTSEPEPDRVGPDGAPLSRIPIDCADSIPTVLVDAVLETTTAPGEDAAPPRDWIDAARAQAGGLTCRWSGEAGELYSFSVLPVEEGSALRATDFSGSGAGAADGTTGTTTDTLTGTTTDTMIDSIGDRSIISCAVSTASEECDFAMLWRDYWVQGFASRDGHVSGRDASAITNTVDISLTGLLNTLRGTHGPEEAWQPDYPRELALTDDCTAIDPGGVISAALPDSRLGPWGPAGSGSFAESTISATTVSAAGISGSPFCAAAPNSVSGWGGATFSGTPDAKWAWDDIRSASIEDGWKPATVAGAEDAVARCERLLWAWRCHLRVLAGDGTLETSVDSGRSEANAQRYAVVALEAWLAAYRTTPVEVRTPSTPHR